MFGFFKKKDKGNSDVIAFLDEADDAYMQAYITQNPNVFAKYATLEVLRYVTEDIMSKQHYFSSKRYMHRDWLLQREENVIYVFFKKVTHDNISLAHNISIPVGDDISERWTLSVDNSKYVVTDIRKER